MASRSNLALPQLAQDWIDSHALLLLVGVLAATAIGGAALIYRARRSANGTGRAASRGPVVAALLGSLAAIAAFLVLALFMARDSTPGAIDSVVHAALRPLQDRASLEVIVAFTHVGDSLSLVAIGLLSASLLAISRQWLLMAGLLLTTVVNGLLVRILKMGFERIRPLHDPALIVESGWSFPSGHAAGSVAVYGMIAYVAWRLCPWRVSLAVTAACIGVVLALGASRVVLQVHFASDVLGGYLLGGGVLLLGIATVECLRARGVGIDAPTMASDRDARRRAANPRRANPT